MAKKILRLKALSQQVVGAIEDLSGNTHDVLQMTLGQHQDLDASDGTTDALDVVRRVVQEVCPTLPAEEIRKMNLEQGKVVITIAGTGIDQVEALYPNAVGPEAPTSPA